MLEADYAISHLSIILFTPLVGALVLLFIPKEQQGRDPLDREYVRAAAAF